MLVYQRVNDEKSNEILSLFGLKTQMNLNKIVASMQDWYQIFPWKQKRSVVGLSTQLGKISHIYNISYTHK